MKLLKMLALCFCILVSFSLAVKFDQVTDQHNYINNEDRQVIYRNFDDIKAKRNYMTYLFVLEDIESFVVKNKLPFDSYTYNDIEKFTEKLSIYMFPQIDDNKDSLFLVFSIGQRKFRARTGGNVRSRISDSRCGILFKDVTSYLRKKDYSKAFVVLTTSVKNYLSRSNFVNFLYNYWILLLFGLIAIIYVSFFLFGAIREQYYKTRVKSKLDKLTELSRKNHESGRWFAQNTCVICLDEFAIQQTFNSNIIALDCGHRFHSGCIDSWTDRHRTCPICRNSIDVASKNCAMRQIGELHVNRYPRMRTRFNLNLNNNGYFSYYSYNPPSTNRGGSSSSGNTGGSGFGGSGGFTGSW